MQQYVRYIIVNKQVLKYIIRHIGSKACLILKTLVKKKKKRRQYIRKFLTQMNVDVQNIHWMI